MSKNIKKFQKRLFSNPHIRTYPAAELRTISVPIKKMGIVEDLRSALRTVNVAEQGIGVAAPQIGITKRAFFYNIPEHNMRGIMVNPDIEPTGELVSFKEGCLSLPGYFWEVFRPEKVWAEWLEPDGNGGMTECGQIFDGTMARLIQHEVDHLDGKLVIDYLSEYDMEAFERAFFDESLLGFEVGGPIYARTDS